MGWFAPAVGLSKKAEEVLREMADSGASEGAGVAEILNTIAENGDGQEADGHLLSCAREIKEWAERFIAGVEPEPMRQEPRLNLPKRLRKGEAA